MGEQLSFRRAGSARRNVRVGTANVPAFRVLKKLEPENSSRLMLGLKYAREELILHQMQDTQAALAKLSLKNAADEQKQLLAKLERLQQLLLSTDLDFEMKLERLRQIRETLRKLDTVIKEESREEKLSKKAAAEGKRAGRRWPSAAPRWKSWSSSKPSTSKRTRRWRSRTLSDDAAVGRVRNWPMPKRARARRPSRWPTNCRTAPRRKNLARGGREHEVGRRIAGQTAPADAQPPMEQALAQPEERAGQRRQEGGGSQGGARRRKNSPPCARIRKAIAAPPRTSPK